MCGCGRRRPTPETVTSAQTSAQTENAETYINTLERQTVEGAEALLRSASNAARNASYE